MSGYGTIGQSVGTTYPMKSFAMAKIVDVQEFFELTHSQFSLHHTDGASPGALQEESSLFNTETSV